MMPGQTGLFASSRINLAPLAPHAHRVKTVQINHNESIATKSNSQDVSLNVSTDLNLGAFPSYGYVIWETPEQWVLVRFHSSRGSLRGLPILIHTLIIYLHRRFPLTRARKKAAVARLEALCLNGPHPSSSP